MFSKEKWLLRKKRSLQGTWSQCSLKMIFYIVLLWNGNHCDTLALSSKLQRNLKNLITLEEFLLIFITSLHEKTSSDILGFKFEIKQTILWCRFLKSFLLFQLSMCELSKIFHSILQVSGKRSFFVYGFIYFGKVQ